MTKGYVDIPEGQVFYRTEGSGEPLLLIHQRPFSSEEYSPMIPILAQSCRVLAIDTLGHGYSDNPPREYEIEAFTQSKKAHIWLDILSSRLSSKMQEVLKCLALFLGLGFSILFTWQLVLLTHSFLVKGTFYQGMVPLPYWPTYVVTCLGLILFVIVLIADFTQSIKQNIENFRQSPR